MSIAPKRLALFIAVAGSGLMTFLIAFSNITDYATNFEFVKHVLSMDTIFENSTVKYRSITHDGFYHAAYIFIIAFETAMAYFFITSTIQMYTQLKGDKEKFNSSKKNAYIGICLGLVLWFVGFTVIGGEWFSMWQSADWNGLDPADRITTFFMLTYLALVIVD
jgi:predicted small integral membrane protein